tara:strand:+ start:1175 stop:1540 length:366 start_codon:yes stop_codon:yes gene_type:complete
MAHFALIENGVVQQVIVVNNDVIQDDNGDEQESIGVAFCQSLYGTDTTWVQTSYNATFRKNYAGIGYSYDTGRDAFIEPQPFASWMLNETTCRWEAPRPYPTDGQDYIWDEANLSWALFNS